MLRKLSLAATAAVLIFAAAAPAQAKPNIGVRGGLSLEPDQIVLGAHHTLRLKSVGFLNWVLPVVEVGFGDDATTILIGTDLVAKLPRIAGWQTYAGGELAWLSEVQGDLVFGGSSSDLVTSILVGVDKPLGESSKTVGFQLKFGLADQTADFKALVLYTFGGN